jgi:hypothetical protein
MKKYQIYQLDLHNQDVVNERKAFMGWAYIINHTSGFNFQQYTKVYEGILPEVADKQDSDYLEDLFTKFNLNHPDDYQGRSLSTSDVVILDETIYYCDNYGWKEVSSTID